MPHEARVLLEDMRQAAERITQFTAGKHRPTIQLMTSCVAPSNGNLRSSEKQPIAYCDSMANMPIGSLTPDESLLSEIF